MTFISNVLQEEIEARLNQKFGLGRNVFEVVIEHLPHLDEWRLQALITVDTYVVVDYKELKNFEVIDKALDDLKTKILKVLNREKND